MRPRSQPKAIKTPPRSELDHLPDEPGRLGLTTLRYDLGPAFSASPLAERPAEIMAPSLFQPSLRSPPGA
jgi:hypothetical protein